MTKDKTSLKDYLAAFAPGTNSVQALAYVMDWVKETAHLTLSDSYMVTLSVRTGSAGSAAVRLTFFDVPESDRALVDMDPDVCSPYVRLWPGNHPGESVIKVQLTAAGLKLLAKHGFDYEVIL